MRNILVLLSVIFLVGCMTVRTYEIEKPRIDTEVNGNQGVLFGDAEVESKESKLGPNRKVSVVEVEFGSFKSKAQKDDALYQETTDAEVDVEVVTLDQLDESDTASTDETYTLYKVKKNDTLQKISHKFYGTTRKWNFIYDVNKDVLKSPNKVYPGVKLKIPTLD